jgi:hypothetical protein
MKRLLPFLRLVIALAFLVIVCSTVLATPGTTDSCMENCAGAYYGCVASCWGGMWNIFCVDSCLDQRVRCESRCYYGDDQTKWPLPVLEVAN